MAKLTSKIKIYGGVNQIGGNKILIEDSEESIFFDFGLSFEDLGKFFAVFLQPRSVNGIGDYLCFGLLPNIPNLYREDASKPIGYMAEEEECPIDAAFISHPHMDHFGLVPFLHKKIPIYASETANKIIECYEMSTPGGLDKEFFNIKIRPFGNYIPSAKWEKRKRNFFTCDKYKGSIRIKFFDVDHSTWGAGCYYIETSDRTIVYTGDLRRHGQRKDLTVKMIDELKNKDIDILLIEGTNIGNEKDEIEVKNLIEQITGKPLSKKVDSEIALKERAIDLIQNNGIPVFLDFSLRDFDRFKLFYEVAKECDRKIVIPVKLAIYLQALKSELKIQLKDQNLIVYKEAKKLGSYDEREYYKWERDIFKNFNFETAGYVSSNLNELIVVLDYYHLKHLVDFQTKKGIYIHSLAEPFNEEMAIDFRRHLEWIKFFNLDYHYLHTSGHMTESDIFKTIEELSPKNVIPIHTKGIEKFKNKFPNTIIPRRRQEI